MESNPENQKKEEELRLNLILKPEDIKLMEELAMLLFYKGECDASLEIYKKMIKIKKKDEYIGFLGYLLYEKGEYKKAIECFEYYLDKNPSEPFIYFLLGNTYSRYGNILEAINNYELAIFLDFDIYKAHIDFAKRYEKLGRNKKALREYIAAYEIDPRDKEIYERIKKLKNEEEYLLKNSK